MNRIKVKHLVAALFLMASFAPRAEAAPHQMQITFGGNTNRSEALTNFPVLVVLSNNVGGASSFDFSNFVTTNGTDLRFVTNLSDTASLNYEIESWNTNAGQASYVWVQVPLIPTNGQGAIWANWGNTAASNQLACTTNGATWTNGYIGVWHMAMTNAAGLIPDSSASPHHGTNYSTTVTTGMVGYGRSLNGSACIDVTGVTRAAGPVTFEYWLRTSSSATPLFLTDCELGRLGTGINNTTAGKVSYYDGTWRAEVGSGLNNGVWHHVVFSLRSGNGTISVDGSVGGTGITYTETAIGGTVIIGGRYSRDLYRLTGDLDEVRISSESRSTNWVWACWLNQASNTVFNNYGAMTAAAPWVPQIQNRAPSGLTTTGATFNGWLVSTGTSATSVCLLWGENPNAWAHTNWLAGAWTNGSYPSTHLTLTPDRTYYYTFGAFNAATNVVDAAPVSVLAGTVAVRASRRESSAEQPGAFVISRPATATNGALAVHYTLGGTGVNGGDYDQLESPAVIPPGASEVRLPVVPSFSFGDTRPKMVTLSIAPGTYGVGVQNSATIVTSAQ
jgi:hypothetical protein